MPDEQKFQYVQLPDSSYAEFPAEMPDDSIKAIIQKRLNVPPQQPPQPEESPWEQRKKRALGMLTAPGASINRGVSALSQGRGLEGMSELGNSLLQIPGAIASPVALMPGGEGALSALAAPAMAGGAAYGAMRGGIDKGLQAAGVPDLRPKHFNPSLTAEQDSSAMQSVNDLGSGLMGLEAMGAVPRAGAALNRVRPKFADILSEGALKIPPTINSRARGQIVDATQRYGITPTVKGVGKLDAALEKLNSIKEGLEESARSGGAVTVKTADVLKSLDEVQAQWANSDTPKVFMDAVKKYRDQVASQRKADLSLDDMIKLKRNLQTQLKPIYDKAIRINPGARETLMQEMKSALEKDVRARLEEIIPEYRDVNSELHKLIKTREFVDRAANRISNYNLLHLRDAVAGGMGTLLPGHPALGGLGAMIVEKIMMDPRVWAKTANMLAGKSPRQFQAKPSSTAVAPITVGDYTLTPEP